MSISLNGMQSFDPIIWLDQHGDYLYRYALLWTGDPSLAEVLLQETLMAAGSICEERQPHELERAWLKGILSQRLAEQLCHAAKGNESQSALELDLFEASGEWKGDQAPLSWPVDAVKQIEPGEFWPTLNRCLSGLPRRVVTAFTLREIGGRRADEICELLDMSRDDLWELLHVARAKLRGALEDEWFRGQGRHSSKQTGMEDHRSSGDIAASSAGA